MFNGPGYEGFKSVIAFVMCKHFSSYLALSQGYLYVLLSLCLCLLQYLTTFGQIPWVNAPRYHLLRPQNLGLSDFVIGRLNTLNSNHTLLHSYLQRTHSDPMLLVDIAMSLARLLLDLYYPLGNFGCL